MRGPQEGAAEEERLFDKCYAERICTPEIQPGWEDLRWFVKGVLDEHRDEEKAGRGGWGGEHT